MSVLLPLRKLKFAVTLAHERHFGKTAERLQVAQPYVSRQIQDFEEELGFRIFRRDRHLVALTDEGRAFIQAAEDIMTRLDRLDTDFRRARDVSRLISRRNAASFLVGYSAFVPTALRHEIRSIQRLRFPSIHLQFRMAIPLDLVESVASGVFQAGVTFGPLDRKDLEQIPLRTEPLHAVSLGVHSLNADHAIRLADLRSRPLIVTSSDRTHPALHQWLLERCAMAGFRPNIVEEPTSGPEALDLVQDGVGTAILPRGACDELPPAMQCASIAGIEPLQIVFIYRCGASRPAQRIISEIAGSLRRAYLESAS
jgi:DNA-binding transcriptional LysR family regulator